MTTPYLELSDGTTWYILATQQYVQNAIAPLVTSVSGTTNQIASTGGVSPTISLAALASPPTGSYTNSNITVDQFGRVTAASTGSGGASGTVTSITAGTGLSGGTITSAGTIAIANTVSASSFSDFFSTVNYNASGLITSKSTGSYTIPSALPTANGQILSSTTAGIMSWATPGSSGYSPGNPTYIYDNATSQNLGIGLGSLAQTPPSSGTNNTAFGDKAAPSITSGNANTAVGVYSLNANTIGIINTAIGYQSLYSNIGGNFNTAVGVYSLSANTIGGPNTAIGYQSLFSNIDGNHNVAVGNEALYSNIDGNYNVAVGNEASFSKISGNYNVAVGPFSGDGRSSYDRCTFVGAFADASVPGLTNATAIGNGASVSVSGAIVLGNGCNVGVGTSAPDPSSSLHLSSTTQGFLEPVMTDSQTAAISSPAEGLQAYSSSGHIPTYYNGTQWQNINGVPNGIVNLWSDCSVGTSLNLTASYNNGTAGVGATLTNTGTLSAFTIDGVGVPVGENVLVKAQTLQYQNGVYTVTNVGSASVAWVLTRSINYDTPSKILPNSQVFVVSNGAQNYTPSAWYLSNTTPVVVGTTALTFGLGTPTTNPIWTVPSGVYRFKATVVGGGAAGSTGGASGTLSVGGAGGGGGAIGIKIFKTTPGSTFSYLIGNGGFAGASSVFAAGSNGGNSTFGGVITARGGNGAVSGQGQIPGSRVTASGGDINIAGQPGGAGCQILSTSGAGGFSGNGGNSYGFGGMVNFITAGNQIASDGVLGSGGSGGPAYTTIQTGGRGGHGAILIEY